MWPTLFRRPDGPSFVTTDDTGGYDSWNVYIYTYIKDKMITVIITIPVVPHKAVAEVSKIGNL